MGGCRSWHSAGGMAGGCLLTLSRCSPQVSDWEIVLEISNVSSNLNHKELTCRAENVVGPAEDSVMLNVTCEQPGGGRHGVWVRGLTQEPTQLCFPSPPRDPAPA